MAASLKLPLNNQRMMNDLDRPSFFFFFFYVFFRNLSNDCSPMTIRCIREHAKLFAYPGIDERIHPKPHKKCCNSCPFSGEERFTRVAIRSGLCFIPFPLRMRPHHFDSCRKKLHLLGFNFKHFGHTVCAFHKNFCWGVHIHIRQKLNNSSELSSSRNFQYPLKKSNKK
ncbi:unnamed protein product [Albugo candida]|uniref:Uncharacterized protein n=1 Tax=Albugo candida TaxID=65357 RepID=A0A024GSH9_9STRA|nr:unnamed protein product [Albugo candida]|eukprot:CCI49871.1 unnamed protein product [Albugo candida]